MSLVGEPFRRQTTASRRTAALSSLDDEAVEKRPHGVDGARPVAREQLQRDQRRPSARRALVLDPAAEQLDLLAEAKLADRAVRGRTLAIVGASHGGFQLVLPLAPEIGRVPLLAPLRERIGLGGSLGQRPRSHETVSRDRLGGPTYRADGRNRRPVRFCSRMCADQPATREHANMAGASGGGISATSSTRAE